MKKLTPRQHLFVHEYLVDLNATQAARRAKYKKPHVQGPRLLSNVRVAAAIAKAMEKKTGALVMTRQEILEELSILGRSDLQNYVEINDDTGAIRAKGFAEMPPGTSRALEMIREDRMIREDSKGKDSIINEKVTFKLHSKINALELLGKHQGLFPTKIEGNLEVRAKLSMGELKKSIKETTDGSGS
ncbi:MAG: terminase small subunit [Acidobacteria bacterium]|nr:terminase small subunit [Acidobacteriota bacterium]